MDLRRSRYVLVAVLAALLVLGWAAVPAQATFPGPNGKVVFTSLYLSRPQIYTMGFHGANKTRMTNPPRQNFSPSWNWDSTRIVFITIPPSGTSQIFMMNAIGSLRTQITTGTRSYDTPAMSPNGKKIVAMGWNKPGDYRNLYLARADGSGTRRFTKVPADDSAPAWSPDGTKIAWTRLSSNGKYDIFVMNTDGTGFKRLTGGSGSAGDPCWSPDGTKIVYTYVTGTKPSTKTGRLWTMDANGANKTRLTANMVGSMYVNASWSPAGDTIAFIREADPAHTEPDVMTVNYPGGGGQDNLTSQRFHPSDVAWGSSPV